MIIPAILEQNIDEIEKKIEVCKNFANTLHIDFIDGKFSPNKTLMDPSLFKKYSEYFKLEAHLMTEEPIEYLDSLYEAGFKRFIGQIEKMSDQVEFVAKAQELGAVGLGVDLPTDLSEIKVSYDDLDMILIMSVIAGESGQKFDPSCLNKIKSLRGRSTIDIEVDGGINDETVKLASQAGANLFTANSALFTSPDPKVAYHSLMKAGA